MASALNQVSKLETLVLQKCKIKVRSFYILITALGKNQTLRSIDFSYNNLSGGKNPQNMHTLISTNKDLVSLSLQDCMLGDDHMASLARGFGPTSKL
jgi:Ran GTPase-activating protein (RanGAP) involved in mRNA processing and transport